VPLRRAPFILDFLLAASASALDIAILADDRRR
jgi:hypothetical protein